MKQTRLNLYTIDLKYIRNLSKHDGNVMSVSPQIGKDTRPFVGIIVVCDTHQYCIPLSSPKEKHLSMKNDVDFTKITDGNRLLGVINFNNMIPVDNSRISRLNIKVDPHDSPQTKHYKLLATKQLNWCQRNQDEIVKKANRLYALMKSPKASGILKRRCCNFTQLEEIHQKWMDKNNDK